MSVKERVANQWVQKYLQILKVIKNLLDILWPTVPNCSTCMRIVNVIFKNIIFQAGELPDDVDWAFVFRVDPDGNVSRVYSTIPERRFVDLPASPTQPSVHSNGNHANGGHFDSMVSFLFHCLDLFLNCLSNQICMLACKLHRWKRAIFQHNFCFKNSNF